MPTFYKTDKIERFLDCAFGSARNDRMRGWNGNVSCIRNNPMRLLPEEILIFKPESSYPCNR